MMPMTASVDDWAIHLARFTHTLRPDWDVPGIRAAINQTRTLAKREDIAVALIELTRRDDIRTPALLATDGPHWRTGRTPDTRIKPAPCPTHAGQDAGTCRDCAVERFGVSDVELASVEDTAALRARIATRTKGTKA